LLVDDDRNEGNFQTQVGGPDLADFRQCLSVLEGPLSTRARLRPKDNHSAAWSNWATARVGPLLQLIALGHTGTEPIYTPPFPAARLVCPPCRHPLFFRLTGRVADFDDTTSDQPEHPNLVIIIESEGDFARIVVPTTVWPLEKRELLAVDRPVAVSGESETDPFRLGARVVATPLQLLDGYH